MALSTRQRVFVAEYLQCWNASEAARRAGYAFRSEGPRLLSNPTIQAYIKTALADKMMSAEEVHVRLAEIAREERPAVQLKALELIGRTHALFIDRSRQEIQLGNPVQEPVEVE